MSGPKIKKNQIRKGGSTQWTRSVFSFVFFEVSFTLSKFPGAILKHRCCDFLFCDVFVFFAFFFFFFSVLV
jgi:hypothetical protein